MSGLWPPPVGLTGKHLPPLPFKHGDFIASLDGEPGPNNTTGSERVTFWYVEHSAWGFFYDNDGNEVMGPWASCVCVLDPLGLRPVGQAASGSFAGATKLPTSAELDALLAKARLIKH